MAKVNGNGLVYWRDMPGKMATENGVADVIRSVYQMWLDNRVAFLVSIANEDPNLRIWVGRPNAFQTGDWMFTKGRTVKQLHEVGGTPESPGELKEHVDGAVIQQFIYPRLLELLVRLYVPENQEPKITAE